MVLGHLIFKARISNSLWGKILDFATDAVNDGYTRLLDYVKEPVNCHVEPVDGTKWCDIQLGADSFREAEWQYVHIVISAIVYGAAYNIESVQYYEWQGLRPNKMYMYPLYLEEYEEE